MIEPVPVQEPLNTFLWYVLSVGGGYIVIVFVGLRIWTAKMRKEAREKEKHAT